MTAFPSAHVAPLLANVTMDSDDLKNYDGTFEMIGGNHSREVFQSLIKDPIYGLQQSYHHRLAAVYKNLSDEEAVALGKEHNMTAETQLASTFYDDVKLTHHLFSTIQQPSEQKMMGFNDEMRDSFMKVFRIEVIIYAAIAINLIKIVHAGS